MMATVSQRNTWPLLVGMLVIILLGAATYYTGGMASRVPAEVRAFSTPGEETSQFWRRGECLLLPEQGSEGFASDCMPSGEHPRILLWGDSYAAAVAQGFVQLADQHHYSVGWLTSSACPPLIGYTLAERPFCKDNNEWVIEQIQKTPPDIVILHSTWGHNEEEIKRELPVTVSRLRAAGVKKIILMGPVHSWKGTGLPANFIYFYFTHLHTLMPKYTFFRSNYEWTKERDSLLKQQAELLGIRYVSALEVMCKPEGCLARAGDNDQYLTAIDPGHLTVPAATAVVGPMLPAILK